MDCLSYKTDSLRKEDIKKKWVIVDAQGEKLGRLCSQVASLIKGKHKPFYTPHIDCGDNVIVVNAEKVLLSGKKENEKRYLSYTGYPGGQRVTSPRSIRSQDPTRLITTAVKGMLPKNRLGRKIAYNLYVFPHSEHNKTPQNPESISLKY